MGTAFNAPAHRIRKRYPIGSAGNYPPPSIDASGNALQDPRLIYNIANSPTGAIAMGFFPAGSPKLTSQVPSTAAVNNIVAAANPSSGVKMSLVSSSGAGITVVPAGGCTPWPNYTNVIPAGAVAIDGLPALVRTGGTSPGGNTTGFLDPTTGISRCVSVTGVGSGSGGTVLISGADWYGYPMSQLITLGAGANTVNSTKAFKFITSVVPNFTDTHAISVGTADIFGLNLAADFFGDVDILWNGIVALLATFTAAVTTSPATTTTGDVRGTFTPANASDGTKRLDIFVTPSIARITQSPQSTGLFGVPQV
jgi:hypothetical protein